jgi:3-dehydroquinate synthase
MNYVLKNKSNMAHSFIFSDYTVFSGPIENSFIEWFKSRSYTKILILTDENTRNACLPLFLEKTKLGTLESDGVTINHQVANIALTQITAGETHKTLQTCEIIWQSMFENGLDRKSLMINLGGGVIGDMGGFCAATYKRGIDFVQVPTTLLSMTDAAVGGKLGIDFQGIKNAVGVFKNPSAVFCDTDFLKTLPERELISGFAEIIKHALIGDPVLWKQLQKINKLRNADWATILKRSLAVKVKVVKKDPFEKNLRQLLNYGHTIGHAVESYFLNTETPLTHGEAIAIGMFTEQYIIDGETNFLIKIGNFLAKFFPKVEISEDIFPQLWELMQQDKKNAAGKVRMAVPENGKYGLKILEPNYQEVCKSLQYYKHKY